MISTDRSALWIISGTMRALMGTVMARIHIAGDTVQRLKKIYKASGMKSYFTEYARLAVCFLLGKQLQVAIENIKQISEGQIQKSALVILPFRFALLISSNNNMLHPVKDLSNIYPDIEGELCSRHSTLFGKLRSTFNKLYDSMEPTHYVVAKGTCEFVQEQISELKLSMALENGVIILTSKTYQESQYYVNGNHFSQQLIFTPKGALQEGLNSLSEEMEKIVQEATQNLKAQETFGGILYVHSNISENCFHYKETFLLAFYISIMTINDNLKNFTKEELVDKMTALKFMGSRQFIQREFFGYKNRKFNLTLPSEGVANSNKQISNSQGAIKSKNEISFVERSQLLLDMNKEFKFLFCRLDLAREDVKYELRRREEITRRKRQILAELKKQIEIGTIFQLFNRISEVNLSELSFSEYVKKQLHSLQQIQFEDEERFEILEEPQKFLQALLEQMNLISSFSNENVNLQELINGVWEINSKYLKLHSEQLVELVEDLKQRLDIKSCMVVNQNFMMIVVKKNKFTELLCDVKQKMNKGELKSKSLFKIEEEEMVLQRWNSDKGIGEKMFTSVPSEGIGIFDPQGAIWFD